MKDMQGGKILIPVLMTGLLAGGFPLILSNYQVKRASDIIAEQNIFERVIADNINEEAIRLFKNKGCLIKHKLRNSISFDCPESIVSELDVRQSRIFNIMDLAASGQIEADKVWADGITGNGIKVAVLDTGIDTDHPELQDSYLGGYDFVNNDSSPEDDNGHGTHVAGIITSNGTNKVNSKGVAPGAGIYMYKVCNSSGQCYEDDIAAAIEEVPETDAKIMSISIGGGSFRGEDCDNDSLAAKVNWLVNQGVTVVAAAGNDGQGVSSPGCASAVIGVGAVDTSNNVPYWSGRGKSLDITAPGVNIYSSTINGYTNMSGTSMAAPHIAGVAALLLDSDPGLTTSQIKTALYDNASPVNKCYQCSFWWRNSCYMQKEVACTSEIIGAGLVNAYGAYSSIKNQQEPDCSSDIDCDDNVACTYDSCVAGSCINTPNDIYCPSNSWFETDVSRWVSTGQCTEKEQKEQEYRDYYCSLVSDCQYNITDTQWLDTGLTRNKPNGTECDDGQFCNIREVCQAGLCAGGTVLNCSDNEPCTTDSCNETMDKCEHVWSQCGISDGCCGPECNSSNDADCETSEAELCWSGINDYLYWNRNQASKFCKCAQGEYGYISYNYNWNRQSVFYYKNSKDNENWDIASRFSFLPIYKVKCLDGLDYPTNQDYYYSK
jgi:hypothetical protein